MILRRAWQGMVLVLIVLFWFSMSAAARQTYCHYDYNDDSDVDGQDLADFIGAVGSAVLSSELQTLAAEFSSTGCPKFQLGLNELPPLVLGPNLLQNPSFEVDSGWTESLPYYMMDDTASRTGSRSLHMHDVHLFQYSALSRQPISIIPGTYVMDGWIKGKNLAATQGNGVRLSIYRVASTAILEGTFDWTYVERTTVIDQNLNTYFRLESHARPDGDAWFDDVSLKKQVAPVVESYLLYPNYKGIFSEDTLKILVTARPPPGATLVDMTVTLDIEGGPDTVFQPAASQTEVTLDVSGLENGDYILTTSATVEQESYTYPDHGLRKTDGSIPFNRNNIAVVDGRPRLILGIYNTSGYSDSPSAYEPAAKELQEMGFNMYLNYWLSHAPKSSLDVLMDVYNAHGMKFWTITKPWRKDDHYWDPNRVCEGKAAEELGEQAYVECRARELSAHPGFGGYYTADEDAATSVRLYNFNQQKWLSNEDPDHPTFVALNKPAELSAWRNAADILGVDPYPIVAPEGQLSDLERVSAWISKADRAVYGARPVWAVLQFFQLVSGSHWPTEQELRTMSWMALIGGADGLIYWSWGARGLAWENEPERTEYKNRLKAVLDEIIPLEAVIISPAEDAGSINDERILYYGRPGHLFAVNNTKNIVTATITLNASAASIDVLYEDRSIPGGTSFKDTFQPYEVHLYRLNP
jgi:hypothetical protein